MHPSRVFAALVLAGAWSCLGLAAEAAVLISVDKESQRMAVVVDGELQWVWPVSTGIAGYDTPNGRYTVSRMVKDHYSREWDDAPMPHSIFFTRIGHAIHGTDQIRRLGRPSSHGCVRLSPAHAALLYTLVKQHGVVNTTVVIGGAVPSPAVAKRNLLSAHGATANVARLPLPRPLREAPQPTLPEVALPDLVQQMLPEAPPQVALAKQPPQAEDVIVSVRPERMPERNVSARAVPGSLPHPLYEARQQTQPEPPPERVARVHAPSQPTVASKPLAAERPPMVREAPQRRQPEPPPQQAAQAYARSLPPIASKPRAADRGPASSPRRSHATPRVYYVEIIEETYVNGTWLRRRYYRPARPSDFFRVR
jgi:hypothetical protein